MNKKMYLSIIVILLVVFVPIIIYLTIYKKATSTYLIFPDNDVYIVENGKLVKVDYDIKENLDVIFTTDEEQKDLTFTYKSNQVIFYEDGEPIITPDGFLLAHSKKNNVNLEEYKIEDINAKNLPKFSDILEKNDIIGYDYLSISSELSIDINNDGIEEKVYFVSNLFEELKYDKVFSFVYYIENDDIVYLQEDVAKSSNAYDLCLPNLNSIININGKKIMSITCEYFSEKGIKVKLYDYHNNKFNLIN